MSFPNLARAGNLHVGPKAFLPLPKSKWPINLNLLVLGQNVQTNMTCMTSRVH